MYIPLSLSALWAHVIDTTPLHYGGIRQILDRSDEAAQCEVKPWTCSVRTLFDAGLPGGPDCKFTAFPH